MGEPDLHVFLCLGSGCSGKYIGWNGGVLCLRSREMKWKRRAWSSISQLDESKCSFGKGAYVPLIAPGFLLA